MRILLISNDYKPNYTGISASYLRAFKKLEINIDHFPYSIEGNRIIKKFYLINKSFSKIYNTNVAGKLYDKKKNWYYPELFNLPIKISSNIYGSTLRTNNIKILLERIKFFMLLKLKKISNYILKDSYLFNKYQNYIDYDDLLRVNKEYQSYMKNMIDKVKMREFFNPEYIDSLWNLHLNGKKNYSIILGLLVTFELIMEEYYDTIIDWKNQSDFSFLNTLFINEISCFEKPFIINNIKKYIITAIGINIMRFISWNL